MWRDCGEISCTPWPSDCLPLQHRSEKPETERHHLIQGAQAVVFQVAAMPAESGFLVPQKKPCLCTDCVPRRLWVLASAPPPRPSADGQPVRHPVPLEPTRVLPPAQDLANEAFHRRQGRVSVTPGHLRRLADAERVDELQVQGGGQAAG